MKIDLNRYKLFKNQKYTISKLPNQGLCNINYIAKTPLKNYLIREFRLPNIDRDFEFKVQKKAYLKGVAPKPIVLDLEQNLMITEFVIAEHLFTLNRKNLKQLALTLKRVHKIKIYQKPHNHKKDFKLKNKKAQKIILKLKKYKRDLTINHHDLNPKNILFANKITLIDWEFARINDRYFDLATISVEFRLNRDNELYFLRQYFSRDRFSIDKLNLYKELYKELCAIWNEANTKG